MGAPQLGLLLGGAVLTETIFNLAGVGRALFDALREGLGGRLPLVFLPNIANLVAIAFF